MKIECTILNDVAGLIPAQVNKISSVWMPLDWNGNIFKLVYNHIRFSWSPFSWWINQNREAWVEYITNNGPVDLHLSTTERDQLIENYVRIFYDVNSDNFMAASAVSLEQVAMEPEAQLVLNWTASSRLIVEAPHLLVRNKKKMRVNLNSTGHVEFRHNDVLPFLGWIWQKRPIWREHIEAHGPVEIETSITVDGVTSTQMVRVSYRSGHFRLQYSALGGEYGEEYCLESFEAI